MVTDLIERSDAPNLNHENKYALSLIDLNGYNVTNQFTFSQMGEVSPWALDQILFNMLNTDQEIQPNEIGALVNECILHRVRLTQSKILPVVSSLLIQSEINAIEVRNTRDQVKANLNVWVNWCQEAGELPFPASGATFARFVESKMDAVKTKTMQSYVWAIRKVHISGGLPDPTTMRSSNSSLKKYYAHRTEHWRDSPIQADPMRLEHVAALYQHYEKSFSVNGLECRNLLIMLIAYDTLLREAELARIRLNEIIERDGVTLIQVTYTKTNRGVRVEYRPLSALTVSVLDTYLSLTNRSRDMNSPLFLGHTKSGRINKRSADIVLKSTRTSKARRRKDSSTFTPESDEYLRPQAIYKVFVKCSDVLNRMGFDTSFSGHSGRVGRAKDLNKEGVKIHHIADAGGWKDIKTLLTYMEDADDRIKLISEVNSKASEYIKNRH